MNSLSSEIHLTIRQNTLRMYFYMTVFTMILGILGHLLSQTLGWGLTGTGAALILSGVINFFAYFFSDRLILSTVRAVPITKEQIPELFTIVEELCKTAALPMPKLYLLREDAMNAFATGRNPKHAAIVVTKGLLEKLQPNEVKGVLAHELAHIQSLDMRLMAIVSFIAGLTSIFADMYWNAITASRASQKDSSGILHIIGAVLSLFAPLAVFLIQLSLSRQREYGADALGAKLAGKASYLAQALEKISRDQIPLPGSHHAVAHLFISSPSKSTDFLEKLMSTHPPIEERITRLKEME